MNRLKILPPTLMMFFIFSCGGTKDTTQAEVKYDLIPKDTLTKAEEGGYGFEDLAESMGFDDTKNMSGKLRSGWELVRADEYPDSDFPTLDEGRYAGVIGVGGLVLARIPEELARQREAYFNQKTADRNEALDNDVLKEQHPSMPINQDRQTRVTFGGSKKN